MRSVSRAVMSSLCVFVCSAVPATGGSTDQRSAARVFAGPLLHAHNCYPEEGRWTDRLDRALSTPVRPIAIEQDLVWHVDGSGVGRSVVAHGTPLSGAEPTLEAHFFEKAAPLMRDALARPRPDQWPLIVLHLDFKTNEPDHHRAIWTLLGKYEGWLTTATRTEVGAIEPFQLGPLLVLTEDGDQQAQTFHSDVPTGARLRIFGTVPSVRTTESEDKEVQFAAIRNATPEFLLPTGATNYRRWVNFSWAAVELGGQARAGAWDAADHARLTSLVNRAHRLGLWVRFYTLNGHPETDNHGWTASYSFGSLRAVELRWRAAISAGVEFIATDQYEEFARVLRPRS